MATKTKGKTSFKTLYAVKANDKGSTHVEVDVYYSKARKAVGLSVGAVKIEESVIDGITFTTKSFMLYTNGRATRLEPMARLNAKRLGVLSDAVNAEIKAGAGEAFDFFKAVVDEQGLTVDDAVAGEKEVA